MRTTTEKLTALRNEMKKQGVDFYYVPSGDAHRSEYVPACWQRRPWISGFTGSAGDVLIGKEKAYLWTDPRYFLQAHNELDPALFELMKQGQGETPPVDQWLSQQGDKLTVAVDPKLMSLSQVLSIQSALEKKEGKLIAIEDNLIDLIWTDRPRRPRTPITIQDEKYAGLSASEKINLVRQKLREQKADAIAFNLLDAICWLFNIRGNDIDFNPFVISYAFISDKKALLFVDPEKITPTIADYFKQHQIETKHYDDFATELKKCDGSVWIDPHTASWWMVHQLSHATLLPNTSPVSLLKAVKNKTEQDGAREAHRIDAVAVIKFLHWIENHWQEGVTEITAANQLKAFREADKHFKDLSFETISGFGPHGAIVHYRVTEESSITIDDSNLYLVDSGAQYHYGTTDITRTIHLGAPTAEQKKHYTLVLQGHLNLRHLSFPKGTCGEQVDVVARAPLWRENLNYGHGTGHGVGSYLGVHEGPQVIGGRYTRVPLTPGMIVSNEPGYYREGHYGIRIENLCLIVEKNHDFYGMDDLTLVPYCRKLIDKSLLTAKEIEWVNAYHALVRETLTDRLDEETKKWLIDATQPL